MNFAQRTLAILSATGTAALMALPVLAQAVPNQGVVNNGDINRIENQTQPTNTRTTDNCAFVSGGVGGPVGSQSGNSTENLNSSYDAARIGVPNTGGMDMSRNMSGSTYRANSGLQSPTRFNQFDARNRSAAIAYRQNGPAGTSGHEAKMNLDALQERQRENAYPAAYNLGTPQASTSLPVACAPR